MIEQLQSLMKALEAGSYTTQEAREIFFTGETGIVTLTGDVTASTPTKGYIMGDNINSSEEYVYDCQQEQYVAKSNHVKTKAFVTPHRKHCDHQWEKYDGFMEGYSYCSLCRETVK